MMTQYPADPAFPFLTTDEAIEKCYQAAFHLNTSLHDLFIVVRLEKVLQACDVFDASEPYANGIRDEKAREKMAAMARNNCQRLGSYRMPLGFLVIDLWRTFCDSERGFESLEREERLVAESDLAPLASLAGETESIVSADRISISTASTFRRMGSGTSASTVLNRVRTPLQRRKFLGGSEDLESQSASIHPVSKPEPSIANLQPFHRTYTHFYRQVKSDRISDEELFRLLAEARKSGGKLGKLKTFPCVLTLEYRGQSAEDLLTRLSPEMLRINPFLGGQGAELTKDILEFPSKGQYAVNSGYRNLLYIYPKSVNLSGRPGTARNIAIKIELMNEKEEPQRVFFNNAADIRMSTQVFTTVIYHNKTPELSDEIKIAIPWDLSDGHHLLFTFYHVSCKWQQGQEEQVDFPIGYTWIPLCRQGSLSCSDFTLPISMDKLPQCYGYLSPDVALPNIRWLEQHKPLFHVNLVAVSTVHTQDAHLEKFCLSFASLASTNPKQPPVNETQLIEAIQGVIKARPEPMVSFLYSILDKLLFLIANPPYSEQVSTVSFETLGQLVKICTMLLDGFCDRHKRSSLLTTYIHYFKISMKEHRSHSALCRQIFEGGIKQPGSPETQKLFHLIEGMERSQTGQKSKNRFVDLPSGPTTNNKALHEEILSLWIQSIGSAREMAYLNAWFFLELLIKSIAEYLSMTGRLYLNRKSRFSERFIKCVDTLSTSICEQVVQRVTQQPTQAASLANSWAFFLRDSFSLMDRSYVLSLVRDFNKVLTTKISGSSEAASPVLLSIKLDTLRIISSHEHFSSWIFPLGMPSNGSNPSFIPPSTLPTQNTSGLQAMPPSPGGSSLSSRGSSSHAGDSLSVSSSISLCPSLSQAFRSRHYLIGLILSDLAAVLDSCHNRVLHAKAIGVVRNLLAAHEADSRLSEPTIRSRIATLYLPLIDIILDALPQLHDPYAGREASRQSRVLSADHDEMNVANDVALAIAGIGSTAITRERDSTHTQILQPHKSPLSAELTSQLLCCLCWVLRNVEKTSLRSFLREMPPTRLSGLLDALQLAVSSFEYRTTPDDLMGDSQMIDNEENVEKKYGVKMRKEKSSHRDNDEKALRALACSEVVLTALDTIEMIVKVVSMPGSDHLTFALPIVLRVLLHMLSCEQSVQTLECVFASQRALVTKFPEMIFEQETEQCAELTLQLLRHCAFRLPIIRSQAAASIFQLFREAWESGESLARVKMHVTMSLSTLVSNGTRLGVWLNEECLRRSLKTVLLYADQENADPYTRTGTSFREQVKDLIFNLHMILSDTVKMKEFANDFHMTIDLMYRVAKGYQNNPDLRVTWLLNMASRQADAGLHAESALCIIHAAALVAEYLAMTNIEEYYPKGAVDFGEISENILEESAVSDDVVSPEVEGICESRHFSAEGLVHLVERGANLLEKAGMYEALPHLYKVIEPIVWEWRDFQRLAAIHLRLSTSLSKIEPSICVLDNAADMWGSPLASADKRCFGTYFRVGFYGEKFGDLDGEEYIYKEPPFTKLSEISSRLEAFYSDRFGHGTVEVIKDSNNVVRTAHSSSKAYLQITYVEPYFEKWEKRRRPTHYERSHNVKRFIFATPFTRDGKAHGDLKDQYKRRTILTTQNAFPYVKSRIRVVQKEQKVLTPIEVAIEDIERKTRELCAAMSQSPPDAKMLQMVVQGCIGTQVNQGPIQVANVFLVNCALDERGKPVDRLQNKLRLCFKDFSKKCCDALMLNKQLIQPDQLAYQNELQRNYDEFSKRMAPILGTPIRTRDRNSERDLPNSGQNEVFLFASDLGLATNV
ncbi:unnamed protein product, partial [Mesorhabditis belari]|uniref:Dedicator of cytokinesis protein 7 n=1 Tax=Mesorhabditis belari TaxID=2138241 RepID=A0AAF3EPX3_9BILA